MTTHRVFSKLRFFSFSQTKRKQLSANYKKCLEFGNPTSQMCTFAPILFRTSLVESMISGPTPSPGIKVTGTRPEGKSFEIIVTIFSWVKQLQKGEQDKRNRSQGEGSQYFADKNDGKPRVTESIGCLIRRVRKDLDKNKESHLESTLALWPEAVDKSWACWRVGKEACWRVGKEASLTMRERGSMLIWKRRIVIKALRIFSHPICFCPTLPMKDYTRALQAAQRCREQSLMQCLCDTADPLSGMLSHIKEVALSRFTMSDKPSWGFPRTGDQRRNRGCNVRLFWSAD